MLIFKGAKVTKTPTHTIVEYDSVDPSSDFLRLLVFEIDLVDYLHLVDIEDLKNELDNRKEESEIE